MLYFVRLKTEDGREGSAGGDWSDHVGSSADEVKSLGLLLDPALFFGVQIGIVAEEQCLTFTSD